MKKKPKLSAVFADKRVMEVFGIGRFKVRAYLLLLSLVAFACEKSSPDEGGDDTALHTEPPSVLIEAGHGLPSGESSANSLEVTVSGNETATEYQYDFFSDESVTCEDATYGAFKSISTKLTEIDLGDNGKKIICIRGKDKDGNVQATPKRYTWTKVDGVALAEEVTPEAKLKSPPDTPSDSLSRIDSVVEGNKITVKYQYVLIAGEHNCKNIDGNPDPDSVNNYMTKELAADGTTKLELNLGADGTKTLCLRGLDEDDGLQNEATRYMWVKITPEPNSKNEKPAAGAAGIGLLNAAITFRSGGSNAVAITVQNVGEGTLKWRAKTARAASWLQVKVSGDNYEALRAGKLASGAIAANKSAFVYFKLGKDRGTDYGMPYKREHEIVFVNADSKYEMRAKIALEIPKLDNKYESVTLTRNSAPVKVYAKNLNKSLGMHPMQIEVVPAFPTTITRAEKIARGEKFKAMVTLKTGLESTGTSKGERYVEFTITSDGKESCEALRQTILVYSNGDSKGASDCSIEAWKQYIGRSTGASWTTRRCKRIVVTFNDFDLNDDGKINIIDLTTVGVQLGDPPDPMTDAYRRADVDGNGKVEQADAAAISECFGSKS